MNTKQRSMFGFPLSAFTLLLAFCLLFPTVLANAASATWNVNSDGAWSLAGNWTPAAAPGSTASTTNTDTATFGIVINAARAVTVDANRNIFGINFSGNSSAYTLSGGNLLLTNGGIIQTSGGGSGHTDLISSAIEIQGNGGSASFTAGSSTATRLLSIGGNVTGVSTSSNTTTLNLNGSNTGANAIGGIISNGAAGGLLAVVKSGAGTWNLNALNTFSGGLEITQGTLATGGSGNFGANGNTITLGSTDVNSTNAVLLRQGNGGDVNTYNILLRSTDTAAATRTINSAVSALRVINANVQIGDGTGSINVLNLGNNIALSGAISQNGTNAGSIIVDNNTDSRLGGGSNNTYTGATTVQNGTLVLSKTGNAGATIAVPGDLNIGTSTSAAATIVRIDGTFGNGISQLAATTVVTFSGTVSNTLFFNNGQSGTLNMAGLNSAAGVSATIGAVNDANANIHTLNLAGSGSYSYAGTIQNSHTGSTTSRTLAVTKTGSGTQAMAGLNTYTGTTSISGGVLSVTTLANGGTASGIGASSNAAGNLVVNGGTLRYTGGTASSDRNFTIGTAGATFDASGTGALTLSGTSPVLSGTNTARTLTLTGTNVDANSLAAVLANNGAGATSLTKNGAGTWVLTGNNSYSGGTTVTAGTLLINNTVGSGTGSGSIAVNGGKIGGTGAMSGALTISGGILSPGASIETLASGALTFNNNSTFQYEVDSSALLSVGADLQKVTGGLNLNNTVTLTLSDIDSLPVAFAFDTTVFTLINYTGAWNGGLFTFGGNAIANGGTFTAGLNTWMLNYNATSGGLNFSGEYTAGNFVNITAIPEPNTAWMLAAGAGVLALLRRRSRGRN